MTVQIVSDGYHISLHAAVVEFITRHVDDVIAPYLMYGGQNGRICMFLAGTLLLDYSEDSTE